MIPDHCANVIRNPLELRIGQSLSYELQVSHEEPSGAEISEPAGDVLPPKFMPMTKIHEKWEHWDAKSKFNGCCKLVIIGVRLSEQGA